MSRQIFFHKRPLSTGFLLEKKEQISLWLCAMRFNSSRRVEAFSNFPPMFKNFDVCRNDIGEHMKKYAEENDLLKNPQRILISNFK